MKVKKEVLDKFEDELMGVATNNFRKLRCALDSLERVSNQGAGEPYLGSFGSERQESLCDLDSPKGPKENSEHPAQGEANKFTLQIKREKKHFEDKLKEKEEELKKENDEKLKEKELEKQLLKNDVIGLQSVVRRLESEVKTLKEAQEKENGRKESGSYEADGKLKNIEELVKKKKETLENLGKEENIKGWKVKRLGQEVEDICKRAESDLKTVTALKNVMQKELNNLKRGKSNKEFYWLFLVEKCAQVQGRSVFQVQGRGHNIHIYTMVFNISAAGSNLAAPASNDALRLVFYFEQDAAKVIQGIIHKNPDSIKLQVDRSDKESRRSITILVKWIIFKLLTCVLPSCNSLLSVTFVKN